MASRYRFVLGDALAAAFLTVARWTPQPLAAAGERVFGFLRVDLTDFFPSIAAPRVRALFRALGYPEEVSAVLAALCTSRAPPMPPEVARRALGPYPSAADVRALRHAPMRVRGRHLPQGAPTSPGDREPLPREEFDRTKAILHNCLRHGPASQNKEAHEDFRAHLTGLVSWVMIGDAARADRLATMLEQIDWSR